MSSFKIGKMSSDVAVAEPKRSPVMQKSAASTANRQLLCDVRQTWTGPLVTQAYDDRLTEMSNHTRNHLYWLARNKQYHAKPPPQIAGGRPLSRCSWTNMSVMFTGPVNSSPRRSDDLSSMTSSSSKVINFCYLCSTMEEHQRNHLKARAKSAVTEDGSLREKRQRIRYTAPVPPCVRKKVEEPAAVVIQEALYKVTVWTGDLPGASTDANVYITITGDQAALLKTRLWRRQGTNMFAFVRGSREVFHIKGPKLGSLHMVTVEHDGLEQRHGWFLERIEVQCMLTKKVWVFQCKNWLSLHHGDAAIRRDLPAAVKERAVKEFEVTVETGKKRFAGTGASVFIMMRGTEGCSPKLQLNSERPPGTCFQRGQTDKFKVQVADIGELRALRIEHDGEGKASSWYLSKVTVRDVHQPQCVYHFVCNGWLAKDMGEGHSWKELRALRHLPTNGTLGKAIAVKYEVLVKTGDLHGAGTMADVYIVLYGTSGKTSRIFLSDSITNFERSKTESFKIKAVDVGDVRSVRIGVDTSGPGSGWLCDHIKIRKNLSRQEISEHLSQLKQAWRKAKQQAAEKASYQEQKESTMNSTREDNNDDNADTTKEKNEDDANNNGEEKKEDDTDVTTEGQKEDDPNREEKKDGERGSMLNTSNRSSSETPRRSMGKKREAEGTRIFDENGRVLRYPVCEEYFFPCSKWFASNHEDGLFERELHVEKRTLCYQDR